MDETVFLGAAGGDDISAQLLGDLDGKVAFQRPQLINKLVAVSTPFRHDARYPEVRAAMNTMGPATAGFIKHSPLAQVYPAVDWERLFAKLGDFLRQEYDWSEQISKLKMPTMIVFADADEVVPEHIVAFYRLLGGGRKDAGMDGAGRPLARMAIVPGTTHYNILSSPLLPEIVRSFIRG